LRIFAVFLIVAAGMAVAQADERTPQPFVSTYEVSYRGLDAGTLTLRFQPDAANGRYLYESRANPSMLARFRVSPNAVERSIMEIGADGVRPLEWTLEDGTRGTDDDGTLRFDWQNGTVTGQVGDDRVDLATQARVQDRLSIQIAAMTALLRGEDPGTMPLIDNNRVKQYSYARKNDVALETNIGKLGTVVYESTRLNSDRMSRFWLAADLDYIPARVELTRKGKVETVMVLTALQRGTVGR
jgi:hypothetical protein